MHIGSSKEPTKVVNFFCILIYVPFSCLFSKITKTFHDVTVQTDPQPPADSDTTVLREALRTVTTFDAPSALGEDQLTALLQSLPRLEELTVRVPSFGTGRWLRLLPTSLRTLYVAGEK